MLPLVKAYYAAKASMSPITFGESDNGNVQIAVEFEVIDHPEFAGETITWIGHFTDLTEERTLESLQIAGWQGDDVSELAGVQGSQVLQDTVSLACDVEEYNGEQRLRVRWVNRPRGRFQFKQEADERALRDLGARLRNTVRSLRAGGDQDRRPPAAPARAAATGRGEQDRGRRSANGSQHPNAPGNRDDIPF